VPNVFEILRSGLSPDLRQKFEDRVGAMGRELRYMDETDNAQLKAAIDLGWSFERLGILCALNSFFQLVIAPLASSAGTQGRTLGDTVPIIHGEKLRFDRARATSVRAMVAYFMLSINAAGIGERLLTASHAGDLVFYLVLRDEGLLG